MQQTTIYKQTKHSKQSKQATTTILKATIHKWQVWKLLSGVNGEYDHFIQFKTGIYIINYTLISNKEKKADDCEVLVKFCKIKKTWYIGKKNLSKPHSSTPPPPRGSGRGQSCFLKPIVTSLLLILVLSNKVISYETVSKLTQLQHRWFNRCSAWKYNNTASAMNNVKSAAFCSISQFGMKMTIQAGTDIQGYVN